MNRKTKLLIINRSQFGYNIDAFSWSRHARETFDITYLGFDAGKPRLTLDRMNVIYISRRGSIVRRYLRFLAAVIRETRRDYDAVILRAFPGCALAALLNKSGHFIYDIRTGSVARPPLKRTLDDALLRLESCVFRRISVVSQSLADKLSLPQRKTRLLPLGAEAVDLHATQPKGVHLLYVGTFSGRRLEDTLDGFARFHSEQAAATQMSYTLIGDGGSNERQQLSDHAAELGISSVIHLPGYIHKDQLEKFYTQCNVGVSYVPINSIYDCQPPTKTFEYLLAGMPVLATATQENARVVTADNGELTPDTAEGFYQGLVSLADRLPAMDAGAICDAAQPFRWERIVNDDFLPLIREAAAERRR